ncbi:hypothetical protein [Corynebacterium macginleyi]|uniref:hypothetical protein n=1 Tax=Corynebacterium macginleyi TaxID=38290 RepID=UPI000EF99679|nr:hypothetical protein [Corynebacterium macginleyi]QRP20935.1 hypothetical protein I6J25_09640 [Corynebacterium macginleyi]RMB65526.1 hypothetical protein D9V82_08365 [Corynebacterium macginleyi]
MAPKETATATVETFFKLLGCKELFVRLHEEYNSASSIVRDYQGRYMISAESFKDSLDTITVRVYDFGDETNSHYVLDVIGVSPELAAKFTRETINSYEEEPGE